MDLELGRKIELGAKKVVLYKCPEIKDLTHWFEYVEKKPLKKWFYFKKNLFLRPDTIGNMERGIMKIFSNGRVIEIKGKYSDLVSLFFLIEKYQEMDCKCTYCKIKNFPNQCQIKALIDFLTNSIK